MPECCVPGCRSRSAKKYRVEGISFHQFPVDSNRCEQWLKVISRKDFNPYANAGYSTICSRHFLASDFRETKNGKRFLLNTAVPSQFPEYPKYMQPKPEKIRKSRAIEKREQLDLNALKDIKKPVTNKKSTLVPKKSISICSAELVTIKPAESSEIANKNSFLHRLNLTSLHKRQECSLDTNREQFDVEPAESLEVDYFNDSNVPKVLYNDYVDTDDSDSTSYFHKSIQVSPECCDKSTLADFPLLKQTLILNGYRRKICNYVYKMKKMKDIIKNVNKENLDLKKDYCFRSMLNISQDAENGNQSAAYLMYLIRNYSTNKYKCVDIPIQNLMGGIINQP